MKNNQNSLVKALKKIRSIVFIATECILFLLHRRFLKVCNCVPQSCVQQKAISQVFNELKIQIKLLLFFFFKANLRYPKLSNLGHLLNSRDNVQYSKRLLLINIDPPDCCEWLCFQSTHTHKRKREKVSYSAGYKKQL